VVRKTTYDFHIDNIKYLDKDGKLLREIPGFPISNNEQFYSRDDKSGWWMVTKQIIIRKYTSMYLNILGSNQDRDLFFIDLLSSWGMNKVTKREGKDQFIFPGMALSAALISNRKRKGFTKLFINDRDPQKRKILIDRFKTLNDHNSKKIKFDIEDSEEKIDSNQWVISVMNSIKEESSFFNYLMVIDNQGMDVCFNTLKQIRDLHEYGDIVITFQDRAFARKMDSEKFERFMGTNIPPNTKSEDLCNIYVEQLGKIGLGNVERIKIETKGGFYYTLLFCCRNKVKASWLRMIEKYRDVRFKAWTDTNVKIMWDTIKGKFIALDSFKQGN
jgi:hypothetical protein